MSYENNNQNKQQPDGYLAGFKLLDRYQKDWQQIHSNSVSNFARVKLVSQKIESLEDSADRRIRSLDDLNTCCKSLKTMNDQVSIIENDLIQLEKTIPMIETILTDLRDKKEQQDCANIEKEMEARLNERKRDLLEDSKLRKEKLKWEHNKRLEVHEQKQLEVLDERRHILEKTFEEEKKRYLESNQKNFD